MEVGAGMGNLSRLISPRREHYIATDIDEEHLARLRARLLHRPRLEVRRCDLGCAQDFRALRESVDTVICLNVLEHIADDMAGLANIHSCLSRGGRAIILVPEGMSLYGTLDKLLGHFRRYSAGELRKKMEAAGFRVDAILEFNRVSRQAWYVSGRILKRSTISRFQMRLFDRMVWIWRKIDSRLPWKAVLNYRDRYQGVVLPVR